MAVNTAQIANLLRPGLNAVFGDYPNYPSQWTEIFDRNTSEMAVEFDVEMRTLGLAQLRAEGANTYYDNGMGQRFITTYNHAYVALGFIVTRKAMKDNLYKAQFSMGSAQLKDSFLQTKEVQGIAVINNAFDATNAAGADGVALCSTAHPIDGSTYANTPSTQVALNETAIEAAIVQIQQLRDQAGKIVMVQPRKMIVPPNNQWQADRLLGSKFRTETANNDISAIYNVKAIPEGYTVNQFMTDTNSWFIKTNADNGFKYFEREKMEVDMFTDFDNDNLKIKGIERYSFGFSNPRIVWGSSGPT